MNNNEKDVQFMRLAHHISLWSKEQGRRVGAVIIGPDDEVRSTGHNGFPRGVNESIPSRHSRDTGEKYFWSSHAERNAIYNAARMGVSLKGCTIYVPWFPCCECAKAIIQSGIAEIVAYEPDFTEPKWGLDHKNVLVMLKEGGVIVRFIEILAELSTGELGAPDNDCLTRP